MSEQKSSGLDILDGIPYLKMDGLDDAQILKRMKRSFIDEHAVQLVEDYGLDKELVLSRMSSQAIVDNLGWAVEDDSVQPISWLDRMSRCAVDDNFDYLLHSDRINVNDLVSHMTKDGIVSHFHEIWGCDKLDIVALLERAGSEICAAARRKGYTRLRLTLEQRAILGFDYKAQLKDYSDCMRETPTGCCYNNSAYSAEATVLADMMSDGELMTVLEEMANCRAEIPHNRLRRLAKTLVNTEGNSHRFVDRAMSLTRLGAEVDFAAWMRRVGARCFAVEAKALIHYVDIQAMLEMCTDTVDVNRLLFGLSKVAALDRRSAMNGVLTLLRRGISVSYADIVKLMPIMCIVEYDALAECGIVVDPLDILHRISGVRLAKYFDQFVAAGLTVDDDNQLFWRGRRLFPSRDDDRVADSVLDS